MEVFSTVRTGDAEEVVRVTEDANRILEELEQIYLHHDVRYDEPTRFAHPGQYAPQCEEADGYSWPMQQGMQRSTLHRRSRSGSVRLGAWIRAYGARKHSLNSN